MAAILDKIEGFWPPEAKHFLKSAILNHMKIFKFWPLHRLEAKLQIMRRPKLETFEKSNNFVKSFF